MEIQQYDPSSIRLALGEAYMICNECGSRLYSFYGTQDANRSCPKKRNGQCTIDEENYVS